MLDRPSCQRAAQRHRARQRDGEGIAPTPFTVEIINFLIATHWLTEREADDRHAIGKAMSGRSRSRRSIAEPGDAL